MLIDSIWSAHPALLVTATAAYAAGLMWLLACDVTRLRFAREFAGWQAVLRERMARVAPPPAPILGTGYFARRRWHRAYGYGWRRVQRCRIDRRRYDRAMR